MRGGFICRGGVGLVMGEDVYGLRRSWFVEWNGMVWCMDGWWELGDSLGFSIRMGWDGVYGMVHACLSLPTFRLYEQGNGNGRHILIF